MLIDYFQTKKIYFDGIYRRRNIFDYIKDPKSKKKLLDKESSLKSNYAMQDYSQIILDFGFQNEILEKVLIISSSFLDEDELKNSSNSDLLFRKITNGMHQYLCRGIPFHENITESLPITLLVPDPRANTNLHGISFAHIVKSINSFFNLKSEETIIS